ncbi:uncharacterized protein N7459_003714 [Penicillium hispanicum]|uniref:uncharacterized protein n=1 Tax=Penicillium hispanicum TaxID=1080232 RepID=UPI00253FF5F5|nr:uncharacterized protein N7459_003714 [Penicillium hispanicum]KAJ5587949.1 hypothetical protein N7459_003714 [Penicillium hispanicum]
MRSNEKRKFDSPEDDIEGKISPSPKRRVIGPSLPPPTSLSGPDQTQSHSQSDSDSDDDFGPSLPPANGDSTAPQDQPEHKSTPSKAKSDSIESRRDQWMLQPPDNSDWANKIDPTRVQSRKFQTGKSAHAKSSKQADPSWVETPEERMRRLQDEVMGVSASSDNTGESSSITNTSRAKAMEEKIKKFNDHTGKNTWLNNQTHAREKKEDDPRARAFDREKDMALSSSISNTQRREMMNKASGYSSRFTKGDFL